MDNYTPIRDGLHSVVESVTAIKGVLDYEPASVQVHPLAWILLDSFTRKGAPAGMVGRNFRFATRIATPIYQSKEAEDELIATALMVADAIERNKQFSGVIVEGLAVAAEGQTGWIMVGGVKCRVVDVFAEAYVKYAF